MDTSEEVLILGRHILHAYIEDMDIEPLIDHLAPDVVWLGAGREMNAVGRDTVARIFRQGKDQLIPCHMSEERELIYPLDEKLWLVQISALEETDPSYKMYLQAYQRCAFVFRKNSEGKWEIAYLNHSIAYEAVKDNELFAISKGIRNFRKLRTPDISLFSSKDKDTLYHLIEQTSLSLSKKEQEVCTIFSLFPRFSKTQAESICQNAKTMKRLLVHWARNPFMAYEHSEGTYAFHPVFREYLQGKFKAESWHWQKNAYMRAAKWELHEKNYGYALTLALKGKAYPTALRIISEGGLSVLYKHSPQELRQILRNATPVERARNFNACALILLAINLIASPQDAREERDILMINLPADWEPSSEENARFLFLEALDSLPDSGMVEADLRKLLSFCKENEVKLPRDYFQGIFRGVVGQLGFYYRRSGTLLENVHTLQSIYDICGLIIKDCDGRLWHSSAEAELNYMQGNIDTADEILLHFLKSPWNTIDRQQRAIIALFLYPRVALIRKTAYEFKDWKKLYKKLKAAISDDLTKTSLDMVAIHMSSLLEEPSPKQEHLIDTINELPEYNALRTMRQSVRHRLNLSLRKYNLILHTTETKDPYPSANASQMSRCYDAIARIGALQYFGKAQEASALLKSALHESLQDYFIMPFIEHYNILKPLLLPLASDPVYAQFLQQARKMAITPISEKALEETTLTPREQLIISRVRDGWTNKEIADELTTIKKHLTELYKKFHVHSRTQLLLEIDKSQK